MFHRLKIQNNASAKVGDDGDWAFKRLDIAAPERAEKTPPVDPHSLEVLRDGIPRYAKRPPGRRVLWR